LTEAELVIGLGRPIDRQQHLPSIQELADRLGATVGASRVAVFQGTLPPSKQIGSSGKWIQPQVYLTLGISGASYHLMGIKGAKHIIAVNTDPDAPIFKLAELGVVRNFEEIVSALLAATASPGRKRSMP
jgi:electron transfer flavoprotein alpha subunit